tara:strand:- start:507 stop:1124 length:618 start_codon:yes stop_codon:yes gene_type:complete
MSKIKVLSPFGPKIAKLKLPKNLIIKINNEVEKIINNKKSINKNDYSKKLVGEVSQEIQLSQGFIKKNIGSFINKKISEYLKIVKKKECKKIKIKSFWVVRQFRNEYNPVHYHNGDISGVGYLQIPKNINKSIKKIKVNGTIDFINGTRSFLSNSIYNHIPKVGDMILFPNYLMHVVYPFSINGERRSFSFNAEIDKKITNEFHG